MDENLTQRAYSSILDKLANGELLPGSRLSNRKLATEIGVSVIPVREAISRLESEGFVERQHGVGSFVPMPSYDELMNIYDLREAIECHAVRKAGAVLSDDLLKELSHCVDVWSEIIAKLQYADVADRDQSLLSQWGTTDAAFHDAIVAASGNRRAVETIRNLRKMSRIFGTRVGRQPLSVLQRSLDSHRQIVEAIRRGDIETSAALLAEHIRHGCQRVLEVHRSQRSRQSAALGNY